MKKKRILVMLVTMLAIPVAAPICQPTGEIRLNLIADKATYSLGEVPQLSIVVENQRNTAISFPKNGILITAASVLKNGTKVHPVTVSRTSHNPVIDATQFASIVAQSNGTIALERYFLTDHGEGAVNSGRITVQQFTSNFENGISTGLLLYVDKVTSPGVLGKVDVYPLDGTGDYSVAFSYHYAGSVGNLQNVVRGPLPTTRVSFAVR